MVKLLRNWIKKLCSQASGAAPLFFLNVSSPAHPSLGGTKSIRPLRPQNNP